MAENKNWDKEIAELETFFSTASLPTEPILLSPGATITDAVLFIKAGLSVVKKNNGNKVFIPYLNRLQEFKRILTTKDAKLGEIKVSEKVNNLNTNNHETGKLF